MSTSDILIGPITLYKAPVGEALPADSTAYGTAWGGNWTDIGWTSEALIWNASLEEKDIFIQQATGAVKRAVTKEMHTFETKLTELTSENLQLALGGTATTTAAGAA